jgi:hypothetical protein
MVAREVLYHLSHSTSLFPQKILKPSFPYRFSLVCSIPKNLESKKNRSVYQTTKVMSLKNRTLVFGAIFLFLSELPTYYPYGEMPTEN